MREKRSHGAFFASFHTAYCGLVGFDVLKNISQKGKTKPMISRDPSGFSYSVNYDGLMVTPAVLNVDLFL